MSACSAVVHAFGGLKRNSIITRATVLTVLAAHAVCGLDAELLALHRRIPRTVPIELFDGGPAGADGKPIAATASLPMAMTDVDGRRFECTYSGIPETFRSASGAQRGWMPIPKLERVDAAHSGTQTKPDLSPTVAKEQHISVLAGLQQLQGTCITQTQ